MRQTTSSSEIATMAASPSRTSTHEPEARKPKVNYATVDVMVGQLHKSTSGASTMTVELRSTEREKPVGRITLFEKPATPANGDKPGVDSQTNALMSGSAGSGKELWAAIEAAIGKKVAPLKKVTEGVAYKDAPIEGIKLTSGDQINAVIKALGAFPEGTQEKVVAKALLQAGKVWATAKKNGDIVPVAARGPKAGEGGVAGPSTPAPTRRGPAPAVVDDEPPF